MTDAGIYQCIATNMYGFASAAGQLLINDSLKPLAPQNVRCTPLNSTTIHVTWEMLEDSESHNQPPIDLQEDDEAGEDTLFNNEQERNIYSQIAAYTINYYPTGV